MIVLVDCDGPLADFLGEAVLLAARLGFEGCSRERATSWDFLDAWGLAPDQKRRMEDRWRQRGYCSSLRPNIAGMRALDTLREFADVYAVTAPLAGSEFWQWERHNWLRTYFKFPGDHIVHTAAKRLVRGDYLIDDKPEHLRAWAADNPQGVPILWAMPHNAGAGWEGRTVTSWADVPAHIHPFVRGEHHLE